MCRRKATKLPASVMARKGTIYNIVYNPLADPSLISSFNFDNILYKLNINLHIHIHTHIHIQSQRTLFPFKFEPEKSV